MDSKADIAYVSALQLLLATVALVFTPLCIAFFIQVFGLALPSTTVRHVASQIGMVTFLPVLLGLLTVRYSRELLPRISGLVAKISAILWNALPILVIVILVLASDLRSSLMIGWISVFAVICMAVISYVIGFVLGGSSLERKFGLATAALARNVGLTLYVANLSAESMAAIPTILAYMLVGVIVGKVGYLLLSKWASIKTA
jgi:BASS family bile acid:Na+ symporter